MDVRGVGEWSGWKNSQSSFERANRDTGSGLTYFENSKLRQWNWGHGSGDSCGSLLDAQPPATNWRTEVIRAGLAPAAVQVNTPITIPIKRMQPLEQNYYLEWGRYVKWPHLVGNLGGNHRCIAHESQCAWAMTIRKSDLMLRRGRVQITGLTGFWVTIVGLLNLGLSEYDA